MHKSIDFLVSGTVVPELVEKIPKQNGHVFPNYNKDDHWRSHVFGKIPGNQEETVEILHGERISGYTRPFAAEDLQNALSFANDGNSESLNNLEVRFRYDLESLFLTIKLLFIQHDFISGCSLYDPKYVIPLDIVNNRNLRF